MLILQDPEAARYNFTFTICFLRSWEIGVADMALEVAVENWDYCH